MNLQPLADRVIVKPVDALEKTKGGVLLPDTAKEKPQEGLIMAVGEGKKDTEGKKIPLEVKKGDHILYGKYSGTEVRASDGEEYLILREEDILAIVKK